MAETVTPRQAAEKAARKAELKIAEARNRGDDSPRPNGPVDVAVRQAQMLKQRAR